MEAVLAYRNDPDVARFQGWPLPFTETDFRGLLGPDRRLIETGWVSWCVCEATKVIGDVGVRLDGVDAEIGITLSVEAQGQGFASEALERLCLHAFCDLDAQRLHAGVNPANHQSIRLFTRAGWVHERTAVRAYRHRDHWDDEAIYVLRRTASRHFA